MDIIKSLFWNGKERRLRLVWRLLIFSLIFAPILAVVQGVIYFLLPGLSERLQDQLAAKELVLSAIGQALVLTALVITLLIVGRFVDRRPFRDYGYRLSSRWLWDFAFGLLLGALLMTGIFTLELFLGWIEITGFMHAPAGMTFIPAILTALFLFINVAFMEETLTRGYLLHNLAEGFNFTFWTPAIALVLAWALSSSIFGLMHLGNPHSTAISTINLIVAGLFLGLGYILTGDLALPIGLHLTWNLFQGNVFGFPVSGTSFNQASFIAIEQRGPELWTGGAFGPEAGLIGLAAIAVGAILTLAWVKWRYGRVQLQASIPLPPSKKRAEQQSQI